MTITLDCTVCQCRQLQLVNEADLLRGKYTLQPVRPGQRQRAVYAGICSWCEAQAMQPGQVGEKGAG